jgi:L-ascorbate metabolism protein UlaG (beta-lactamase superfamily)
VHLPEPGRSSFVERNSVHVEFLRLSHGPRFPDVQNLGHIITLGGQRVLHLGDAGTDPRNFRPYALADRALDVALVPYWYFLESDGRRLVDEHLRARLVIACHIPAGERAQVAEMLAKSHPHVVVPAEPMQTWTSEAP